MTFEVLLCTFMTTRRSLIGMLVQTPVILASLNEYGSEPSDHSVSLSLRLSLPSSLSAASASSS